MESHFSQGFIYSITVFFFFFLVSFGFFWWIFFLYHPTFSLFRAILFNGSKRSHMTTRTSFILWCTLQDWFLRIVFGCCIRVHFRVSVLMLNQSCIGNFINNFGMRVVLMFGVWPRCIGSARNIRIELVNTQFLRGSLSLCLKKNSMI